MPEETTQTDIVLEVLRAIALVALHEEQKRFEQGQIPEHQGLFHVLSGNALDETEVTKLDEGIGATKGRCIKLPERQKDGVWWAPLLWITPKKPDEPNCDHLLQLVIAGTERLFGFRWEPPEGAGEGIHDYWHAQPIVSVRTIQNKLVPLGLPDGATCTHAPAFPLHVGDRLSLIDALFAALYGPSYLEEYVKENANVRTRVLNNRTWAKATDRAAKAPPAHRSRKRT
jgi:hypothetical protein